MRNFAYICANFNFSFMEKTKLQEVRTQKGFTQRQIADLLCMDVANYNRREKGAVKPSISEWEKLAKILETPLEDIYEESENQVVICNNTASVNYQGTTTIHPVPEFLLATQQKYIEKLEAEIAELRELLGKK